MENKTVKEINVNIDIAPTMIEMSGQTVNPDDFDGISLLPFVMEENEDYLRRGKFLPFIQGSGLCLRSIQNMTFHCIFLHTFRFDAKKK